MQQTLNGLTMIMERKGPIDECLNKKKLPIKLKKDRVYIQKKKKKGGELVRYQFSLDVNVRR